MDTERIEGTQEDALLDTAARWHIRRTSEEWSVADEASLARWLNSDERHLRAYRQTGDAWNAFDRFATAPELIVARRDALTYAQSNAIRRWSGRLRHGVFRARIPLVAGLCLTLLCAALLVNRMPAHTDYATGIGEFRVVVLPDGSHVSLDAASSIRAHFNSRERRVELMHGQARFDIAHDASRPFDVEAGAHRVRALGTNFNIDTMNYRMAVTLFEGSVLVSTIPVRNILGFAAGKAASVVRLTRGQQLVADAHNRVTVASVDVEDVYAWEQRKLIFDDTTLADVVGHLNRYVKSTIVVSPAASNLRVSAILRTDDAAAGLRAICDYLPVRLIQQPDGTINIETR